MNLYKLTGQYMALLDMAQDADPETLADTLEAIGGEIEDKADGYAKVIKELEGKTANLELEIIRLRDRKKTIENNIRRMKEDLKQSMTATGKTKFKTLLFSFGIQNNPASVFVRDETLIPKEFFKEQAPVLDKTALKDFLKKNGNTDYAELIQTESLRIR